MHDAKIMKLLHLARVIVWYGWIYGPRLALSPLIRRAPVLWEVPGVNSAPLRPVLENVNVYRPTRFCRVMTHCGSDKGRRHHNYTPIYSALLSSRSQEPLRIFELGLGTDNPKVPSSMGTSGIPGASLRGWRTLFPKATIVGADIDRNILFSEVRITSYYCDQTSADSIKKLWKQPDLREGVDIIIDDGLHTYEANTCFLENSLRHLRPKGIYVVEDINQNDIKAWQHALTSYTARFKGHHFVLVEIPNLANSFDNNLLIVLKACSRQKPTACNRTKNSLAP
jgi:hypothetical protein